MHRPTCKTCKYLAKEVGRGRVIFKMQSKARQVSRYNNKIKVTVNLTLLFLSFHRFDRCSERSIIYG